jgi:hypothetical protein
MLKTLRNFVGNLFRATPENPQFSLSDPDAWRTYLGSENLATTNE